MALFELNEGRLAFTSLGDPGNDDVRGAALAAIREQVVEVLGRPLFPLGWSRKGRVEALTALDPSGRVTVVEVAESFGAQELVDALVHLSSASAASAAELQAAYPGGPAVYNEDWESFRAGVPARVAPGPRLVLLTTALAPEVRDSAPVLAAAGIELREIDVRRLPDDSTVVTVDVVRAVAPGPVPATAGHSASERRDSRGHAASFEEPAPTRGAAPARRRGSSHGHAAAEPPAAPYESLTGDTQVLSTVEARSALAGDSRRSDGQHAVSRRAAAASQYSPAPPPALPTPGFGAMSSAPTPPESTASAPEADRGDFQDPVTGKLSLADVRARGHRSTGPVLGAQPTVPSGEDAEEAMRAVAASLDTPVTLVWQRMRRGIHHEAVLYGDGRMVVSNGRVFTDPSAAANAVQYTQDTDGWRVWRLGVQGPTLASLYAAVLSDRQV